jgi:hypothetical protein
MGISPAEVVMGRKLKTMLDLLKSKRMEEKQLKQK